MQYSDEDLLYALRTGSVGERYQRVIVVFHGMFAQHGEAVSARIKTRALAAHLDPDVVLNETIQSAMGHLERQALEESPEDSNVLEAPVENVAADANGRFEFTGRPGFEDWLLVICGSSKFLKNGGIIPTLLGKRRRTGRREQLVSEHVGVVDENHDETAAVLRSINLEELLEGVDPVDRCLFEFNKAGLSGAPSAETVISHAGAYGLSPAFVTALTHRARLMTWPKRRGRCITQQELSILFQLPDDEVTNRIRATMQLVRKNLDRTVAPYPHWSAACGRRKMHPDAEY